MNFAGKRRWLIYLALLGSVLLAAYPLLSEPGLLNTRGGGDSPFLLQRLHQLETAVRDGHFPVRWMRDANYGYGYPFFHYYAPLSLYIMAAFRFLGAGYVRAIHFSQLLGFLVAAGAAYRLGKRWWGDEGAGLITAVAYTAAPFHLVNVYTRGDSLAEFWAMAFYPLVLLAADHLLTAPTRQRLTRFALAYAGLVISHNISALIFSPFLLLYLLLRGWGINRKGRKGRKEDQVDHADLRPLLLSSAAGLLLALALAAWFFLPALAEQSLAQLEPVTAGYFHYSNHFRGRDLIQTAFFFDFNPDGGVAFRLGLVQALLAGAGLVAGFIAPFRGQPAGRRFTGLALLIATLMITPLSRPLWDHLPLLPFTQFPWRFLSVVALAGALATGGLLAALPKSISSGGRAALLTGLATLLLVANLGGLETDHLLLGDADVTAERLAEYEWFTGNIGTTISAEYLPGTVAVRPFTSPWLEDGERHHAQALSGELLAASLAEFHTQRQTWRLRAGPAGATVSLPTLHWPGWTAAIDGEAAPIRPSPGGGLLTVDVPPGDHILTLRLRRPPLRLGAELLSLAALLLALWLLRPARPIAWLRARWRRLGGGLLALLLFSLGLHLWPAPDYAPGTLTWDFAQMGYLHHDAAGVPFSHGGRLARYDYSAERIAAGETLTVTLTLDAPPEAGQIRLGLATPAVHRFETAPLFAEASVAPPAGEGVTIDVPLPVPNDAPGGLVTPRLIWEGERPLLPSGGARGDLFLRPLRIEQATAGAGMEGELAVRPLAVTSQPDSENLLVNLAWHTPRPLSRNYNVSLRLLDGNGGLVSQFDAQPGYGFQPSSGWPPGHWAPDWLTLPAAELTGPSPYRLMVRLYEVGGELVLHRRLGEWAGDRFHPNQPSFTLPPGLAPAAATFRRDGAALIGLRGYTLARTGETATITLAWEALGDVADDYTRFVHLVDAAGQIVAQADGLPQGDSYPTSQWTVGEIVVDPALLDLGGVESGGYRVLVGFYRPVGAGWERLTAVDGAGDPVPENRFPLPETLQR